MLAKILDKILQRFARKAAAISPDFWEKLSEPLGNSKQAYFKMVQNANLGEHVNVLQAMNKIMALDSSLPWPHLIANYNTLTQSFQSHIRKIPPKNDPTLQYLKTFPTRLLWCRVKVFITHIFLRLKNWSVEEQVHYGIIKSPLKLLRLCPSF